MIEACRLRLRPILMTSFAFILGVLPLVISTGSGSEMRQAVGVAVFFGMIGVTLFGLIFTPIFYMIVRGLAEGRPQAAVGNRRELSGARRRHAPIRVRLRRSDASSHGFSPAASRISLIIMNRCRASAGDGVKPKCR